MNQNKDREDFMMCLRNIHTEEDLLSPVIYALMRRSDTPEQLLDDVRQAAYKLGVSSVEYSLEQWMLENRDEYEKDPEGFASRAAKSATEKNQKSSKKSVLKVFTAQELSEMDVPPQQFVIEGLIPMGLGLLVAKPKIGKSWMILDLCLSVAAGEPFLGYRTHQHGTLYLALEDGEGRLQDRMNKVLHGKAVPKAARFSITASRIDDGLIDELSTVLDANPDIRLVCIDTLSKVKPKEKAFENVYSADYGYMGVLKNFADSRGIGIIVVHHTSKRRSDDPFESINGSTGIMGASDYTIILNKGDRNEEDATLSITGRDIEQQEQVVRFDKEHFRWTMQGSAAEIAEQRRIADYEANPIVKTLRVILQQGDGTWTGNAKALNQLGERYAKAELAPTPQALSKAIVEIEPLLYERDAIKHSVIPNGSGGKQHSFRMFRTDNTNEPTEAEQTHL